MARRKAASSDQEKDFWKLAMNAVFGKTCERVEQRSKTRLIGTAAQASSAKYLSQPSFRDAHIISDDLLLIESGLHRSLMNKPIALGAAILGIAKEKLSQKWYSLKAQYGDKIKLCYSDTDSFLYHVETADALADFAAMPDADTSNLAPTHPLYSAARAKQPGFWKCETGERPIASYVGLHAKLYSIEMADGGAPKQAAAGIPLSEREKLTHEAFTDVVSGGADVALTYAQAKSEDHILTTRDATRLALCAYDDKVYVLSDGVCTRPHGHY